ncbi:hypothetical protein [Variovorax rhizosphaerae]|uniref:Uncharacterized protein n=1 Tax=Variovorax rhizosphaerae TaxID=1836200 RepID=A0ABU8WPJ5_9BURK
MTYTELWPPLSLIRGAFERDVAQQAGDAGQAIAPPSGTHAATAAQPAPPRIAEDLLLPLTELAQRREAVAQRAFPARWAPGRLLSIVHEGRLLGVLLDKCIGGDRWQGWIAAGETDWASALDVLLEPGDEPFEPSFGMVQAWNPVTLDAAPQLCARVQGELSATRLAAIRAVHDEWATQQAPAVDAAPGRIALRTVAGVFSVLSGTPLGDNDPRSEYQAVYRDAAGKLGAAVLLTPPPAATTPAGPAPPSTPQADDTGWGARLRQWFGADRWVRPAFAVLALAFVAQNMGLFNTPVEDEEVRFRSVATEPAALSTANLVVLWKAGVTLDEAGRALRAASVEVVGGPDVTGAWQLHATDPVGALAALEGSPLVQSVRVAEGQGAR